MPEQRLDVHKFGASLQGYFVIARERAACEYPESPTPTKRLGTRTVAKRKGDLTVPCSQRDVNPDDRYGG